MSVAFIAVPVAAHAQSVVVEYACRNVQTVATLEQARRAGRLETMRVRLDRALRTGECRVTRVVDARSAYLPAPARTFVMAQRTPGAPSRTASPFPGPDLFKPVR